MYTLPMNQPNTTPAGNRYVVTLAGESVPYFEDEVTLERAISSADALTREAMGAATGEVIDLDSGVDGGTIVYQAGWAS